MFQLKPISRSAVSAALTKADRYRLRNEPREAESICRDVLQADAENQEALTTLLLALTDQFASNPRVNIHHAQELIPRLNDEYDRCYYAGVIIERWAKAQHDHGAPGNVVFEWFSKAMDQYEKAERLSPADHDEAKLRWNTCARIIQSDESLRRKPEDEPVEAGYGDDIPMA